MKSLVYKRIHSIAISLFIIATTSTGTLHAQENLLETIRVTGKSLVNPGMEAERAEIALTPGGVTLIDGDELRERNVSSLADMLRYVPGVWSASASGNDGIFFSSRGSNLDGTDFDMNGIKLLQDGLPVTTADGNNHNRIIDPLSAHHATVARGANAVSYGASTLGGAINFTSPTAHDNPAIQGFFNGGSHGQITGRATVARVFDNEFDALLTVEAKQWDGYRRHNKQDRHGLYSNAGWKPADNIETRFFGSYVQNNQELPGTLNRAQVEADPDQASASAIGGNFQLDLETWRIANKTTWLIDEDRRLDIGFSVEEQKLFHPIVDRVLVDFDGPGPGPAVEVFSLLVDTDHRDIGAVLRYSWRINSHDLLFGANYGKNEVTGGNYRNLGGMRNGLTTVIDNDAWTLEAYAMDRWSLNPQWTVVYGAQLVSASRDVRNTNVADGALLNPADNYFAVNPRAGIIYQLGGDSSLYANVSRLYEPPTNFELEDDVSGGSSTLAAMKGTVVEIGTRGSEDIDARSRMNWELSLYYSWIEDEILSIDDPNAPGTNLVTNIDNTIHAGIEAAVSYSRAMDPAGIHTITPLLSFTINEFKFDNDATWGNNRLPAAPRYIAKGEILYRNANGFYFGPTFDLVGDRYADFANTFNIDSYELLGLRTGWNGEKWKVFAEIRNLLDEEFISRHNVRNVAAADAAILSPGEPLSAYFGIELKY